MWGNETEVIAASLIGYGFRAGFPEREPVCEKFPQPIFRDLPTTSEDYWDLYF
jgi:hypothetical protein